MELSFLWEIITSVQMVRPGAALHHGDSPPHPAGKDPILSFHSRIITPTPLLPLGHLFPRRDLRGGGGDRPEAGGHREEHEGRLQHPQQDQDRPLPPVLRLQSQGDPQQVRLRPTFHFDPAFLLLHPSPSFLPSFLPSFPPPTAGSAPPSPPWPTVPRSRSPTPRPRAAQSSPSQRRWHFPIVNYWISLSAHSSISMSRCRCT